MESRQTRWANVAVAGALLVLGGGAATARALTSVKGDWGAVISGRGGGRRVQVGVGAVTNSAGVGGDALAGIAHDAMEGALASRPEVSTVDARTGAAQQGARVRAARGHVFDANIQTVRLSASSVQASVSIVVSTAPGRAYEFESTSSITLSGPGAVTADGQADCVRRAMSRATERAVDQLLQ